MTTWQSFFVDYLNYLEVPFTQNNSTVTTYFEDGESLKETSYALCKNEHKAGVIGFYPGTNFFYNVLEGSVQKGAFVTQYLASHKFFTSNKPFVPYLYMYVQLISPALHTPRKAYSLMVNLHNETLLLNPVLKGFVPVKKGECLPKNLSYKAAFKSALLYIKEDLVCQKDWLEKNRQSRDAFLRNLKKAGLSKTEEELRLAEATARIFPRFEAQLKLLGRLYIK